MRAEWKGRTFFAEVAEALAVDTDQVLAAWQTGDNDRTVHVLYSTSPDADPMVYEGELYRREDGVLLAIGSPKEAGLFSSIAQGRRRG